MQTVSSGASRRLQMAVAGIPLKASLCTACQTQAIRAPFNLHNASIWANHGPRDQRSLRLFYKYAKACYSKCGLWLSIPNITWELRKNAKHRPQPVYGPDILDLHSHEIQDTPVYERTWEMFRRTTYQLTPPMPGNSLYFCFPLP